MYITGLVCLLLTNTGNAQDKIRFDVIEGGAGKRHVTIIPAGGYDGQGRIKDSHNPNSIVYQHAQMIRDLQRESLEINRQAEAEAVTAALQAQAEADQDSASPARLPMPGTEGKTMIEQLVELDKRGGKASAP